MFYNIKKKLLTIFGDIKIYPYPCFVVYCPDTHSVKGPEIRQAMDMVQIGDLILRKYVRYLDGYFIPGEYSHTGIYIGNGIMIHAIAEGVVACDIIDYLRCDAFIILRPSSGQEEAVSRVIKWKGKEYDFSFKANDDKMYCHELAASAYKELNIKMVVGKVIWFLKTPPSYLSESFLSNANFETILEVK